MYGGYYVTMIREGKKPALIAGPYETFKEADRVGPMAKAAVLKHHPENHSEGDEWGVALFQFHRRVDGQYNDELWVKPFDRAWN